MTTLNQFTPVRLLELGHRAETGGDLDTATYYYRHLAERFPFTPEGAEAQNALGRMVVAAQQAWRRNSQIHGKAVAQAPRTQRPPAAPRDHYPLGRNLSLIFTIAGWFTLACGVAVPAIHFGLQHFTNIILPFLPPLHVLGVGLLLSGVGLLMLCFGLIAGALFDQANAVRDLVALERAKAPAE